MHDDDDEFMVIPDGGSGQASSGGAGPAGLDACGSGVGVEEFIAVFAGEDFRGPDIAYLFPLCGNDAAEILVFHGVPGKAGHVFGGGVVIFIRHAVGIDEMGAGHADGLCLFIHHVRKGGKAAGGVFSNGCGGAVVGNHHHLVLQVSKRKPFPAMQGGGLHVRRLSAHRYRFIGVSLFDGKNAGHDFCHAGGIFLFRPVLFIEEAAACGVHDDCGVGGDFRRGGIGGKAGDGDG